MTVLQKDPYSNKVIRVFENIKQVSEVQVLTGIDGSSIVSSWLGERRTAGGFSWSIIDYIVKPNELWKHVGTSSRHNYYISHKGSIKSVLIKSGLEFELKAEIDKDGYRRHSLHTSRGIRLGRLVARMFIGEPKEGETVDHINGIVDDDRVKNLRWLSREENSAITTKNYAWAKYDLDDNLLQTFSSGSAVQKHLGLDPLQYFKARLDSSNIYKGFKWYPIQVQHMKMPHSITKEFDFDYGHRVWSQTLDGELSCNSFCKCTHLHGHIGSIIVELSSCQLNKGMVLDFTELKFFKKWIDDVLDHKFILDINDPEFTKITGLYEESVLWNSDLNYGTIPSTNIIEDSFVIVDFIPTSEHLARFLYGVISKKLEGIETIKVTAVTFKEGPKTSATYRGE